MRVCRPFDRMSLLACIGETITLKCNQTCSLRVFVHFFDCPQQRTHHKEFVNLSKNMVFLKTLDSSYTLQLGISNKLESG